MWLSRIHDVIVLNCAADEGGAQNNIALVSLLGGVGGIWDAQHPMLHLASHQQCTIVLASQRQWLDTAAGAWRAKMTKEGDFVNLWAFSEENENNTTCDVGFPGERSCPCQFDMQTILDDVVRERFYYSKLKLSFIKVSIIWAFRPHGGCWRKWPQ